MKITFGLDPRARVEIDKAEAAVRELDFISTNRAAEPDVIVCRNQRRVTFMSEYYRLTGRLGTLRCGDPDGNEESPRVPIYRDSRALKIIPTASYSPTQLPAQYYRLQDA